MAAPDPKNPDMVYGSQRSNVSRYNRRTAQTDAGRPRHDCAAAPTARATTATCARCRCTGRRWTTTRCSTRRTPCGSRSISAHSWTRISPDLARQTWAVPGDRRQVRQRRVTPAPMGSITALVAVAARRRRAVGRHRRRQHPGDDATAARRGRTSRRRRSSRGRASSTSRRGTSTR